MDSAFEAALHLLVTGPQGLAATYTALTQRLTPTRAGYLDNLAYLTGPVALQANTGTMADAASTTTTIGAALNHLAARLAQTF